MNLGWPRIFLAICLAACLAAPARSQGFDEQVKNLGSTDYKVQSKAVQAIQKASMAAAPALLQGLKEGNPRIRLQCFKYLREFHSQADLDPISNAAFKEDDFLAQQYGVMAIASFRNAAAVERLEKFLDGAPNLNIRTVALRNIASIGGKGAIPLLISVLNNPHQPLLVRVNAGRELARLGDASGHGVALESLHDSLALSREAGIQTLGLIGRQSDGAALEAKTKDQAEGERMRLIAKKALRHLALANVPQSQRLDSLEKSLADSHAWVREWAAGELAESKEGRARALLESAASHAKHPGRREAGEALQIMRKR